MEIWGQQKRINGEEYGSVVICVAWWMAGYCEDGKRIGKGTGSVVWKEESEYGDMVMVWIRTRLYQKEEAGNNEMGPREIC